jgi:YihY family inner membrane protein
MKKFFQSLKSVKEILSLPISTSTSQLSKAGAFLVFQAKMWTYCARLLRKNRAHQQAAALSYHTIFGLVPLVIVMLMIFQLFPAYSSYGEKIKAYIYSWANFSSFQSYYLTDMGYIESEDLTMYLDNLIAGFFKGTDTGAITIFSGALIIWAALALLSTIEKAFNNIWHISKLRSFVQRTINYWAVLTLGPLLIGIGIYLTTRYSHIGKILRTFTIITPAVLSFLITTLIFFLLYFILPNTKVKTKPAIWGAAVAALVWVIAKTVFGYCVTELKLYSSAYGLLALIPITVLWIYITWLVVLFGLQLTFTTQNLQTLDAAEIAATRKREEFFIANEFTLINIVAQIADAFERSIAPVEQSIISSKLNLPPEFCEKILNLLVAQGILIKTSEPKVGYVPARNPEKIKLSDVAEAFTTISFRPPPQQQLPIIPQLIAYQKVGLEKYNIKQIIGNV